MCFWVVRVLFGFRLRDISVFGGFGVFWVLLLGFGVRTLGFGWVEVVSFRVWGGFGLFAVFCVVFSFVLARLIVFECDDLVSDALRVAYVCLWVFRVGLV